MKMQGSVGRYLGIGVANASKRLQGKQVSPAPSTTTLQQLKTKGTITSNRNFNAEAAARKLHVALQRPWPNQGQTVIEVLTSHSNHQRQSIKRHYKFMFGKKLENDINNVLAGHFKDVYMALLQDSLEYLVEQLHYALMCVRPDEKLLIELLCNRSNNKLRQIKEVYHKRYGRSLDLVVKRELSGDMGRLMRALLNNARDEREDVDMNQAHLDAQMLASSGVGTKYGTDDAVVAALLNTRSYAHLQETFDEYRRLTGKDVEESIQQQFRGPLRQGLLSLVKAVKDPVNYFTERLHDSIKDPQIKDQHLIRLLVSRSELDLLDIKEHYLSSHGVKLSNVIADGTTGDYENILFKLLGY